MIINPNVVVSKGYLSELLNEKEQIQQNGVDLTIKSISSLSSSSTNIVSESARQHCSSELVELEEIEGKKLYVLEPGVYEVLYNELFNIPNGVCVTIHTRSTIIRGGNFVASGLYDAGFNNYGGGVLHITRKLIIEENSRIAQAVYHQAEDGSLYDGVYQKEQRLS